MSFLKRSDKLLVIIGPSGSGKSSAIKQLESEGFITVTPSWTTRPRRKEELKGSLEHRFVSESEFARKRSDDYFLEAVKLFDLPYSYGLPRVKKPLGNNVPTVMLRVKLLPLLNKYYNNYVVYQIEDNPQKISKRLLQRESEGHQLGTRLSGYETEIKEGRKIANRTFSNKETLKDLTEQIKKALDTDFNLLNKIT